MLMGKEIGCMQDVVDPVTDEMLVKFVVDSYFKSQPKGATLDDKSMSNSQEDIQPSVTPADPEIIPQDLLKKYITFAKLNVFPRLHDADLDKFTHVYVELRREYSVRFLHTIFSLMKLSYGLFSKLINRNMFFLSVHVYHEQGVPIAVRHIESMIRMSEAHARMHLRQHVTQEDVDMAIRVLMDSFILTKNFGVQKALQKSFKKYMTFKKDFNAIVLHLLHILVKDALHFEEMVSGSAADLTHIHVEVEELQSKALDYGIADLKPFFNSSEFSRANTGSDKGSPCTMTEISNV